MKCATRCAHIKGEFGGKVDLLVYSIASGKRRTPNDGVMHSSVPGIWRVTSTGSGIAVRSR